MSDFSGYQPSSAATLLAKLGVLPALQDEERSALATLAGEEAWIGEGRAIVADGEIQPTVCLLLDGWACRCKDFRDGRRQIIAFLTPGDFICGDESAAPRRSDHAVRALTRTRVTWISRDRWRAALVRNEGLAAFVFGAAAREAAILRAWLVNLGQRSARERMAWLFCDLAQRLGEDGPSENLAVPLSQQTLAHALGLTPVHVNRVLQQLRGDGLIDFHSGTLTIRDPSRLRGVAGYDGAYLRN
jgi:CRP-like cAMP-binding protein